MTSRPLQNRVTPLGDIVANDFRGALMGNRGGRIHDPETKTLTRSRWKSKQWIACVLEFKNRHRTIMGEGYTELFFFDEACALAAGHRPCFECRRADAVRFAKAWAAGNGLLSPPRAPEMDAVLHDERQAGGRKRTAVMDVKDLPDGAMIDFGDVAFLVGGGFMRSWAPGGYGQPVGLPDGGEVSVLTPPSIVSALRAGYAPQVSN